MKVKVPVIIQDQMVAQGKGIDQTEFVKIEEEFFLDGPVGKRVAILDFDQNGRLKPGVQFTPSSGNDPGAYKVSAENILSDEFIQVNAFATVYLTMEMFEEPDALGRKISWAFNGSQLLVVPRAGEWANAYYERDSHSLQLFYFPSARSDYSKQIVYTSLASDIIAHETGHAVLDGIAADLYDAITPQSLALHEAVADLTALMMSVRSRKLVSTVLEQTNGLINESNAFSSIAEEFGAQRMSGNEAPRPLRSLLNDETLPDRNDRKRTSPHALSEVLTGALYTVFVKMHDYQKKQIAKEKEQSEFSSSGEALFRVREHFKRMVFRALDYLPPGEVSFADYGRAIIAADQASHPQWPREREWIAEEFVKRKIVHTTTGLFDDGVYENEVEILNNALKSVDLTALVKSDWVAYDFANRLRDSLRIPKGCPFRVRPRLDVTKKYWAETTRWESVRECIFKVSWDHKEENPRGYGFPSQRQVTVGTMLAIGWPDRGEDPPTVRALLNSDLSDEHQEDRNSMLTRLRIDDRLKIGQPNDLSLPLRSTIVAETSGNLMRIRSAARMLHIDGLADNEEDL